MDRAELKVSSSKFAWLTRPGVYARPAHDIVVASNDHFVAVPSLGALVPGWLLLIPRRPMPTLSLLNFAERKSLVALRSNVSNRLSSYGSQIYAFEHGGSSGSLVSCGVDQAHLHLVPLEFDLLQIAQAQDLNWRTSIAVHELTEKETVGKEYLFVERSGASLIGFPEAPTSQWFRQLIAQKCGVEEWDYKRNPNLNQLEATAVALTAPKVISGQN